MAVASLCASNLGFDEVQCSLVADKSLTAHVIEIIVVGPSETENKEEFKISTLRYNPAVTGAVTGNATYASFLSSLKRSGNQGPGFHFC
jgi:aspartate dehydrogenase